MKQIVATAAAIVLILLIFSPGSAVQGGLNQKNPWNGTWTSSTLTLYIQQNGTDIQGMYEPFDTEAYDPGRLEGSVSANGTMFSGKWIESGVSNWTLSEDKNSFTAIGKNNRIEGLPEAVPYEFNGTRTGEIADPKNIWSGEWASSHKVYNMTQDTFSISGVNHPLPGIEDEDGSIEGIVTDDGKTLMNWTETGDFSFTLSEDGKFFNGTYTIDLSESEKTGYWNWNMTKTG